MNFNLRIKRTDRAESDSFPDIPPATAAAQIALWMTPVHSPTVEWISIVPDDPHGPHPLPLDPIASAEHEVLFVANPEHVETIKSALAYLAASVDHVDNEALSDAAADLYRELWDADGPDTFRLSSFLRTPLDHLSETQYITRQIDQLRDWCRTHDGRINELNRALDDTASDAGLNAAETRIRELERELDNTVRLTEDLTTALGETQNAVHEGEGRITDLENEMIELKSEVRGDG